MKNRFLMLVIVLMLMGFCGCTTQQQSDDQENNQPDVSSLWIKDPDMIFAGTTSTSSIVLENGTVRMYIMDSYGGISFAESNNGKAFGDFIRTDISIEQHPTNPCIVYIQGMYLLFYNVYESDSKYLWRAESSDGISFINNTKVAGPRSDYSQPVDVPDVIILTGGKLRIYCTQPHDGINTAVSYDLGKNWVTDGQNLVSGGACDPDVHIENGTYVMYYADLVLPDEALGWSKEKIKEEKVEMNYIRKAVSNDGIDWETNKEDNIISPLPELPENGCVFDPDYVQLLNGTEIIYFARATGEDKDEGKIDLYRAVKTT